MQLVVGIGANRGTYGSSSAGIGLYGVSNSDYGVWGQSSTGLGVTGRTSRADNNYGFYHRTTFSRTTLTWLEPSCR